MVEDEIARLEGQIGQLQTDLNHEKEVTKQYSFKQFPHPTLTSPCGFSPLSPNLASNKGVSKRNMPFETKTLHFISKAIKGDYDLKDFSVNNGKLRNSRAFSDHKENSFHDEGGIGFHEKGSRKSGMLKPSSPSPLREPRHPTPKVRLSTIVLAFFFSVCLIALNFQRELSLKPFF